MPALLDAPRTAPAPRTPASQNRRDAAAPSAARDAETDAARERRQFARSDRYGRPDVDELAEAVDRYKITHRRRFITYEELLDVVLELGYVRP